MTTPFEPASQTPFATFDVEGRSPVSTNDPDDPPWSVGAATLAWLASVVLLFVMQVLAAAPYIFYKYRQADFVSIEETIRNDPNVIVVSIVSVIPAHLLTLAVVWALVTHLGRRPFWRTLGWSWGENFGFWSSAGAAFALLLTSMALAYFLGGDKTPFEQMLESSDAARLTTAFIAVAGAPLVEELIYRGMLYPALRKRLPQLIASVAAEVTRLSRRLSYRPVTPFAGQAPNVITDFCGYLNYKSKPIGVIASVALVSFLFTLVHVAQYNNNYAAIATIGTLSLFLTCVRAGTGRLLPCFVIHLIYNGVLVCALIYQFFVNGKS